MVARFQVAERFIAELLSYTIDPVEPDSRLAIGSQIPHVGTVCDVSKGFRDVVLFMPALVDGQ